MAYRVLVDENVDPSTAELLRDGGHEALHIEDTLGKGTADPPIADHAREHDYLVLTNDADFLRPERRRGLTVLYVPENTMRAHEIARIVDTLANLVPDPADLPAVTGSPTTYPPEIRLRPISHGVGIHTLGSVDRFLERLEGLLPLVLD